MLPCPYFDPIPANGIKWSHIWHFYSVNQSCHPYVSNRGASVVLPITPGRPGCPNMGSFWSLSFLPFVSLGYPLLSELPEGRACPWSCSCPRTLNGTTALPTISWCSPTWKTFQVVNHIAFTSCLKGLNYTVLHKCRRKWSSVKAQRCRLQEFLNGERQQLTFPSTFPGMTLFPARLCSTHLPSQSAPAEEPEHWPAWTSV